MKKILIGCIFRGDPTVKMVLRCMRLTVAFLLFACLHVTANGFSQEKITLTVKGAELKKVLQLIEKKTNYRFLYQEKALVNKPKVSLSVIDEEIDKVLQKLFLPSGIQYRVMQTYLVVLQDAGFATMDLRAIVEKPITGKVTAQQDGTPLAGVSIIIKGSTAGVKTDNLGNFSITVPDNAVLIFSYVGFDSQEIVVGNQSVITVLMKASTSLQNEVVVIGYGTASKRDLTGSITKIAGKEVADKPNSNPISSLQGKVAGMSVTTNGTPGKAPDVRIRGTSSIGQVQPLYVVDGIFNDNIDYINPNDIESIEVLKDASSLAIFGVRGATGVIAITTKKAKAGQVVVNFSGSYGNKKLTDKIKMVDAEGFKTLFAEERANNGITAPYDYTGLNANTDWIDAVTRTGQFYNGNLSLSASSDKNRFNLGFGYISDEGIVKHERLQKWLLSLSDEFRINKAVKVGINLNASRQNNPYDVTASYDAVTTNSGADILNSARKVIPQVSPFAKTFQVQDPYSKDSSDIITQDIYSGLDVGLQNSGVVNPLLQLENEWNKVKNYEIRTVGSVFMEIAFLKNFTFRSTFYADYSNVNRRKYTPLYYAYNPKDNKPYLYTQTTSVREDDMTYKKFQQDYVLNYKKNFGEHGLTLTGGFTTYYYGNFNRTGKSSQGSGPTALPIPNDERFWYVSNGFQDPSTTSASSSQSEYSTVSFLGRVLYNYKSKYFLNLSFRDDASSRLPEVNRHQQFWAVGAAWDISKENFMQNQEIFDYLKIKASTGVLGNQTASKLDGTPLNYPFYPGLVAGSNAVFGTNVYVAANPEYIPNPDLKWETVSAQEAGVELNSFKNRLHFEFNYYIRTTKDLMTYVDRSAIGLKNKLVNGGSIRNNGEEFMASWNQEISRDFSFTVSGNLTLQKNKVESLSEDLPTGVLIRSFQNNGSAESRTMPGQPIGSFYGYVVEGIYQDNDDIQKSPSASSLGTYRPGDFKFKDVNADGKITVDDRTVIGNPSPNVLYGASVNVVFKRFNLGVDIVGVSGNQVFRTWGSLESPFQRVNYPEEKLGRWHGPGTSNTIPLLSQGDRFNYNGSSYNIESGAYVRVRNIQLGYNFSQDLLRKWKIKNLRLYINVQNLKTWKSNLGYTAEFGGDATAFGYDNAGGAIPVVSTAGFNLTF